MTVPKPGVLALAHHDLTEGTESCSSATEKMYPEGWARGTVDKGAAAKVGLLEGENGFVQNKGLPSCFSVMAACFKSHLLD